MKFKNSLFKIEVAVLSFLIKIWSLTLRLKLKDKSSWEKLKTDKKPKLIIFWHRHLFYLLKFFQNSGFYPLISLSSDGELIAAIARKFGLCPIRGSSSRGGAAALLKILKKIKDEQATVLITADGPRGPAGKIKPGILKIMETKGVEVFPVSWYASRKKIFKKSWDQFILPLPFSTIFLAVGNNLQNGSSDLKAEIIEDRLNLLEKECINYFLKGVSDEQN